MKARLQVFGNMYIVSSTVDHLTQAFFPRVKPKYLALGFRETGTFGKVVLGKPDMSQTFLIFSGTWECLAVATCEIEWYSIARDGSHSKKKPGCMHNMCAPAES